MDELWLRLGCRKKVRIDKRSDDGTPPSESLPVLRTHCWFEPAPGFVGLSASVEMCVTSEISGWREASSRVFVPKVDLSQIRGVLEAAKEMFGRVCRDCDDAIVVRVYF
jgi:hypothetical protein